ncbi:hypothetical protein HDK77DRAFT_452456 [Phyllosticta capitalensis]
MLDTLILTVGYLHRHINTLPDAMPGVFIFVDGASKTTQEAILGPLTDRRLERDHLQLRKSAVADFKNLEDWFIIIPVTVAVRVIFKRDLTEIVALGKQQGPVFIDRSFLPFAELKSQRSSVAGTSKRAEGPQKCQSLLVSGQGESLRAEEHWKGLVKALTIDERQSRSTTSRLVQARQETDWVDGSLVAKVLVVRKHILEDEFIDCVAKLSGEAEEVESVSKAAL